MRRILLTVAAMLIPVAGLTLGVAGTAGAGTGKILCTNTSGTATGTITISGCTGGNTGGAAEPVTATTLATGGTLDWVSGSTTTINAPTLAATSATKCPGYVKKGTNNPAAEGFTATITGDTGDGMLIPGAIKGAVCIAPDGTITTLKATEFSWTSSAITCTGVSGSATGNVTVSGCTGGDTGGGSTALPAATLATGGTIHWLSGGSTTIGAPTLTPTSATHCPGYVKKAASNPAAESFTAAVTSDTGDGLKLPGTAKGAVCVAADGTISALKPLSAK
jgi:hypothetical protein